MAVWSEVFLRNAARVSRFDPEYFQPHFLEAEALLSRLQSEVVPLGDLVVDGYRVVYENTEILPESFDPKRHVKYLQAANISSGFPMINDEEMGWVDKADWERYEKGHIRRGELLVEVKGKAEKVALVPDDFPAEVLVSGTLYKMLLDESRVDTRYVLVYLLGKFGTRFRNRSKSNILVSYVNKDELYSIPIPIVSKDFQQSTAQVYVQAEAKYREAQTLYAEAEALLLDTLGLSDLTATHAVAYEREFQEVARAGRFDAEYFQPKYYRLMEAIEGGRYDHHPLESFIYPIRNGFDFRDFQESGTPYIRVGDVHDGNIDIEGAAKIRITSEDVKKDIGLQVGDVLFTRKGSFGNAAVVRDGQQLSIISSEIMLVRSLRDDVLPDFLSLFLNSPAGFLQVERHAHGAAFYSISQYDLGRLAIIIPPLDVQEAIADLVNQSRAARSDAKNLLETAKRRVEELIEEGA